jgi:beige protein homolog 1
MLLASPRNARMLYLKVLLLISPLIPGWFLNGAAPLWEFVGGVLEFLDSRDIATQKPIKSSESYILALRKVFNRLTLFQLSEIEDSNVAEEVTIALLDRILFWQAILFSSANQDGEFIRMLCYHLYVFLFDSRRRVRLVASNVPPASTGSHKRYGDYYN